MLNSNVGHHDEPEQNEDSGSSRPFRPFDKEEAKAFRVIDRNEENKLVMHYQKTKDVATLKKLLDVRDQTIRYMAKKYAYLDNEDDMYSEFKGVWLRCVKKYDPTIRIRPMRTKGGKIILDAKGKTKTINKRTPFNTYLYTSMKNRVWNIIKRRHSKKLLDGNGNPVAETTKSLDYVYGEDGETTLKDILPDTKGQTTLGKVHMSEMIKHLAGDDPDILRAISNFISNPHFGTLTEACNFRAGTLKLAQWDRDVLSLGVPSDGFKPKLEAKLAAEAHLKKMVMSTGTYINKFDVVDYVLQKGSVDFVVKVKNHRVLRKVKEAVLRCRELMAESRPEGCVVE